MNLINKSFILFIMVIHSESGRIGKKNSHKLDTMSDEYLHAGDLYDDGLDGNSFYDDDVKVVEIENSASQDSFVDRLKKLPAKVLISLYNSVNELQSGMGKIFKDRKLTEGAKQSLGAIYGLVQDGFINTKDLAFG